MCFIRREILSIRNGVTLALVLACNAALAQSVTITQAGPIQAPIPAWAVGLVSLMLAALGYWALRTRLPKQLNRLRGWPLLAILSAGSLALVLSGTWMSRVYANCACAFNITGNPTTVGPVALDHDIALTNVVGGTFTIGSVSADCTALSAVCNLISPTLTPQCAPGLTLNPTGICYVKVHEVAVASSRTYKDNIQALSSTDAAKAFSELQPVTFNYKTDLEQHHVGFIAEDVPDLVATINRKTLNTMDIVAVLTKVVQDKSQTIDRQQQKLEAQTKLIEAQRSEVAEIKEQISQLAAEVWRSKNLDKTARR